MRGIGRGLGPVKWHQANRRVPFGAQKQGCINHRCIGCFMHTSPLVTSTGCIVGRSRAHTVVTVQKAGIWPNWLCVGGGEGGAGGIQLLNRPGGVGGRGWVGRLSYLITLLYSLPTHPGRLSNFITLLYPFPPVKEHETHLCWQVKLSDVTFHEFSLNGYPHKLAHGDWFGGKGNYLYPFACFWASQIRVC